jgi:hypothetical protein
MLCPRCGTANAPEREACSRCAGSLAPAPGRDRFQAPLIPLTRRAEIAASRAAATQPGTAATLSPALIPASPEGAVSPAGDLYLLASERSTGQPRPPGAASADSEPARADTGQRTDRFVPRLSPAP